MEENHENHENQENKEEESTNKNNKVTEAFKSTVKFQQSNGLLAAAGFNNIYSINFNFIV